MHMLRLSMLTAVALSLAAVMLANTSLRNSDRPPASEQLHTGEMERRLGFILPAGSYDNITHLTKQQLYLLVSYAGASAALPDRYIGKPPKPHVDTYITSELAKQFLRDLVNRDVDVLTPDLIRNASPSGNGWIGWVYNAHAYVAPTVRVTKRTPVSSERIDVQFVVIDQDKSDPNWRKIMDGSATFTHTGSMWIPSTVKVRKLPKPIALPSTSSLTPSEEQLSPTPALKEAMVQFRSACLSGNESAAVRFINEGKLKVGNQVTRSASSRIYDLSKPADAAFVRSFLTRPSTRTENDAALVNVRAAFLEPTMKWRWKSGWYFTGTLSGNDLVTILWTRPGIDETYFITEIGFYRP